MFGSGLLICPVCSGLTEDVESPLAAIIPEMSGYLQCQSCGSSSDASGFVEADEEDLDDLSGDLF
jgi:hypothetical protein